MDQYDYYQKWENTYITYDAEGNKTSFYYSAHKRSTYGRPCNEIISHYITYHSSGQKHYEVIDQCDCKKTITKEYDESGKMLTKTVLRTTTKALKASTPKTIR